MSQRIEVLAAEVYTLDPPEGSAPPGIAFDIFSVVAPESAEPPWDALREELVAAVRGELSVTELVAAHTRGSRLPAKVVPAVTTEVKFDNEGSRRSTIVEVQAADRRGLLHALTHALASLGVEIQLAMITTQSGQAYDSFYLRKRGAVGDAKIRDRKQLARIEAELKRAVEELRADDAS